MSIKKPESKAMETKILSTMFLATAIVLLINFPPFTHLKFFQTIAGLYLFFFPVGFLLLKAFKETFTSIEEIIALSLTLSITVNVLAILAAFLIAGIKLSLLNNILIINSMGIIFYAINWWRNV